jgi:hypothetical protein
MAIPDLPPVSGGPTSAGAHRAPHQFDLSNLNPDQLLELRMDIDQLLPVKHLKDLNLQRELVLQLLNTQRLQNEVMRDDEVPANQKGQIAGQVASILNTLGKLQIDVYSSERLKQVEGVLIGVLNTLPTEQQEEFLTVYEKALGKFGG